MAKKNPSAERSKRSLANALIDLMREQPFESISVTDIANKAGYARQTFYQHFSSKEEIAVFYIEDRFDRYLQQTIQTADVHDGASLLDQVCEKSMQLYWGAHRDIAQIVMHNDLGHLLVEALSRDWAELFAYYCEDGGISIPLFEYSEEERELIYRYISGGPFHMFYYWTEIGKTYDEEKLQRLLYEMLRPLFIA